MSHTSSPQPLRIETFPYGTTTLCNVVDVNGERAGQFIGPHAEADARRFVAAADLLEACERLLGACTALEQCRAVEAAEAAIAKATGAE